MRKKTTKAIIAATLSLSMVLTAFGSSIMSGVTANADTNDDTVYTEVLGKDDITLREKWDDTSNIGEERTVTIQGTGTKMTIKDNGKMRPELSSQYLALNEMGAGINLGNTMESILPANLRSASASALSCETAWNQKVTTQEYINEVHSYGINTIRIPIAWSNTDPDDGTYKISDEFMGRIEEIVNYALNNGMYVVINDHWDNQWWGQFGACKLVEEDGKKVKVVDQETRDAAWARYTAYWTQICERFKGYSDHLIFEGANEELGDRLNDAICTNGYAVSADTSEKGVGGNLTTKELFETANKINQTFVNIVRNSGGNNVSRHLLIPGYNTEIDPTCDDRFQMPTDIEANGTSKLFLSVHYYTPWDFCGDGGYGDYTSADQQATKDYFAKLKKFTDAGYAIIIGECGICNPSGVSASVTQWLNDTFTAAQDIYAVPVLWETGQYFDRESTKMVYNDIAVFYNTINDANGDTSMTRVSGGVPDESTPSVQLPAYLDEKVWGKKGIHAYLFYQTSSWDYRNAYKPFRSLGNNEKSYAYIQAAGSEITTETKVTDVYITSDGKYTVSLDGIDFTNANSYRMLGISTDIDHKVYADENIAITNATIKVDDEAVTEDAVTLVEKDDDKYYDFMAINIYDEDKAYPFAELNSNEQMPRPSQKIEITFNISGLSKVLADIADKSYIDPETGFDLNYTPETQAPTTTPDTTTKPVQTPSVSTPASPVPTATVTPVNNTKSTVNTTFTAGSYKYKVTKATTANKKGSVTLTGLTKKGKTAKKLSVATSVKNNGTTYTVNKIGANAFKGAKATTVILSKNITTIPAGAFSNCTKLSKITVNGKLKTVAKNAFKGCKKKITVKGSSAKVKKANSKKLKKSGYKKFK